MSILPKASTSLRLFFVTASLIQNTVKEVFSPGTYMAFWKFLCKKSRLKPANQPSLLFAIFLRLKKNLQDFYYFFLCIGNHGNSKHFIVGLYLSFIGE